MYIVQCFRRNKERGNVFGRVARNAAANGCYQECEFGVLLCKSNEPVHGSTHIFHAFHCGNGITMPLQALALPYDCSEPLDGKSRCTTIVLATSVTAKDKDFVVVQPGYTGRRSTGP